MVTALLGIAVSALLIALGARVYLHAGRDGGVPEHMIGLFFLCVGVGAFPALLANDPGVVPASAARPAMAIGHGMMSLGFGALFVFAWRCFGAEASWRQVLAAAGCSALTVLWIAQGLVESYAAPGGAVVRATALVRGVAIGWAFGESLRYHAMMRRRVRVGLADPVVANRFLLWCLWTGSILGATGVVVAVRFLIPEYGAQATLLQRVVVVTSVVGLGSSAGLSLWLAFFPPGWYVARLRAPSPA